MTREKISEQKRMALNDIRALERAIAVSDMSQKTEAAIYGLIIGLVQEIGDLTKKEIEMIK